MAGAVVPVSRLATALRELMSKYADMVVKDPALTSKIESALRLASYVLPGGCLVWERDEQLARRPCMHSYKAYTNLDLCSKRRTVSCNSSPV